MQMIDKALDDALLEDAAQLEDRTWLEYIIPYLKNTKPVRCPTCG